MKKLTLIALALAAVGAANAQMAVLYTPTQSVEDQGISVRPWGSGTVSVTDQAAYEGTKSIRIYTTNFFQGAWLDFAKPISLSSEYSNPNDMLQVTVMIPTSNTVFGGKGGFKGGFGGGPAAGGVSSGGPAAGGGATAGSSGFGGLKSGGKGGPGLGSPGGRGGQGGPAAGGPSSGPAGGGPAGGGFSPGGKRGGAGGQNGQDSKNNLITIPTRPLKMIRLVISTSDGLKSEAYLPADVPANQQGWSQIAIPVSAINGFGRTNKQVVGVAISGDQPTSVYLGELKVVNDPTPITGQINDTAVNLAVGDTLTLSASGYGGATILKYEWDFNYTGGTFVDEAEGQAINHTFNKPGTFKVMVRISDKYGKKASYENAVTITVNG